MLDVEVGEWAHTHTRMHARTPPVTPTHALTQPPSRNPSDGTREVAVISYDGVIHYFTEFGEPRPFSTTYIAPLRVELSYLEGLVGERGRGCERDQVDVRFRHGYDRRRGPAGSPRMPPSPPCPPHPLCPAHPSCFACPQHPRREGPPHRPRPHPPPTT